MLAGFKQLKDFGRNPMFPPPQWDPVYQSKQVY